MFRWLFAVLCVMVLTLAVQGSAVAEDTKPAAAAGGESVIPVQVVTDLDGHRLILTCTAILGVLLIVVVLQLNTIKSAIEKSK
jgi:hypothetical protein